MTDVPTDESDEPDITTVTEGYFEEEYYVNADDAGDFLIDLGEQLKNQSELTLTGEDWELPFAFRDPINLDIEFEGDDEQELEIEVELTGHADHDTPDLA